MAKKSRQISLCMNSYEIAARMPNFSKWVRDQLLKTELRTRKCMRCYQVYPIDEFYDHTCIEVV